VKLLLKQRQQQRQLSSSGPGIVSDELLSVLDTSSSRVLVVKQWDPYELTALAGGDEGLPSPEAAVDAVIQWASGQGSMDGGIGTTTSIQQLEWVDGETQLMVSIVP
jgi:hypothetical protein